MGSGREPHGDRARPLGEWIARAGYHLLTGGGAGVMAAVTEAFVRVEPRRGLAIGILPAAAGGPPGGAPPGYPNPWVEIAVRTHLDQVGADGAGPASRNHLNVLSSSVVVVLPGSAGTAREARLAVRYGRPCIAWLAERGEVPGLPAAVPAAPAFSSIERFVRAACRRADDGQGAGLGMR
jgi:uncharacterized protein (TIGR00725 family)